jgi:hypothetical protein
MGLKARFVWTFDEPPFHAQLFQATKVGCRPQSRPPFPLGESYRRPEGELETSLLTHSVSPLHGLALGPYLGRGKLTTASSASKTSTNELRASEFPTP